MNPTTPPRPATGTAGAARRSTDGPVHTHFGLSYAAYLVVPRTLLQSMPEPWQQRLADCLAELHEAFAHVPQAEAYEVTAVVERDAWLLDDDQARAAGVAVVESEPGGFLRYFRDGRELGLDETVPVPVADPVPHYDRGRTYIRPADHTR
ncbi:hypothetical protein [Kitasatospora purpeofusca]|uniref:hypothetical protein n=1 Tax=Kitasatospora purpeofusca TaxID=67352 RepID=UPI000690E669|nr:hypothetical protein [Kitasatospora purpeofusca]